MIKVYFFLHDGSVIKMPLTRFEKMHEEAFHRRPPTRFCPELAGKRLRCALVVVRLEDASAMISHVQTSIIHFDKRGAFDQRKEWNRTVLQSNEFGFHAGIEKATEGEKISNRRELLEKFKWAPSTQERGVIRHMVADELKKKRGRNLTL